MVVILSIDPLSANLSLIFKISCSFRFYSLLFLLVIASLLILLVIYLIKLYKSSCTIHLSLNKIFKFIRVDSLDVY